MSASALAAHAISFAYAPGVPTLRDVSASFPAGTVTAIIGPNGAGKSTLLRLLLGVLEPAHGRITLDDRPLAKTSRHQRARRLAYAPQRSSVAFAFSARAVVALGRFAADSAEHHPAVDRALRAVDMLAQASTPFGNLSVGQQQRVTLARALAQLDLPSSFPREEAGGAPGSVPGSCLMSPASSFLLLDEPVSAMDPAHALHAMNLLRLLSQAGVGVVTVLHDLALVARYADRVLALSASGSLLAQGSTREILRPDLLGELFGAEFRPLLDPSLPEATPVLLPVAPRGTTTLAQPGGAHWVNSGTSSSTSRS